MVRKRSRTSRKHYESEDNDTDSDYALDDSPEEPAPKKYSLRQRKRSLFLADYEYEDDEDIPPPKTSESDDDFEVENELVESEQPLRRKVIKSNVYIEPEPEISMPEDELIDFEDVIRADIVVNRNRIDYDNIISKSEIKVQLPEQSQPQPVKAKRGRKPKIRPETEVDSSILEPETEVKEEFDDLNDRDYDPQDDLDIANEAVSFVSTELQEEENKQLNSDVLGEYPIEENNVDSNLHCQDNSIDKPDSTSVRDPLEVTELNSEVTIHPIIPERNIIQKSSQESVIKFNESSLQVNGSNYHIEQPELHLEFKQELADAEEDDDVVFIEDKNTEVIVLDD